MNYCKVDAESVKVWRLNQVVSRLISEKTLVLKEGQAARHPFKFVPYGQKESVLLVGIETYEKPSSKNLYHGGWVCDEEPTFTIDELRKVIPSIIGWGEEDGEDVIISMK